MCSTQKDKAASGRALFLGASFNFGRASVLIRKTRALFLSVSFSVGRACVLLIKTMRRAGGLYFYVFLLVLTWLMSSSERRGGDRKGFVFRCVV